MAIFAVALAVISQSYVNGYMAITAVRSQESDRAERTLLTRFILSMQDRDKVEEGGKYETLTGESIPWDVEIEETEMLDLFRISIRADPLLSREGDDAPVWYVLRPSWSEPQERKRLLADRKQDYQDRYNLNRPLP